MKRIFVSIFIFANCLMALIGLNSITAQAGEPGTVQAGREADGRRIDVCIATVTIDRNGVRVTNEIPGKFTNGQCYFSDGRSFEQVATNFRMLRTTDAAIWGPARILSRENPHRDGNPEYAWELEGAFPAGRAQYTTPLTGQRYSLALYSCRGSVGGGVHSGVVGNGGAVCFIPYGGRTEVVRSFEVLYIIPRTFPHKARLGSIGVLCPNRLIRGNRDFGGNGPRVRVRVVPSISSDGSAIDAFILFEANEIGGDESAVRGTFTRRIWEALPGTRITRVDGASSTATFTSGRAGGEAFGCNEGYEHHSDRGEIAISNTRLIRSIGVVGDTGGDDISSDEDCGCDTKITRIVFGTIEVTLSRR